MIRSHLFKIVTTETQLQAVHGVNISEDGEFQGFREAFKAVLTLGRVQTRGIYSGHPKRIY